MLEENGGVTTQIRDAKKEEKVPDPVQKQPTEGVVFEMKIGAGTSIEVVIICSLT